MQCIVTELGLRRRRKGLETRHIPTVLEERLKHGFKLLAPGLLTKASAVLPYH